MKAKFHLTSVSLDCGRKLETQRKPSQKGPEWLIDLNSRPPFYEETVLTTALLCCPRAKIVTEITTWVNSNLVLLLKILHHLGFSHETTFKLKVQPSEGTWTRGGNSHSFSILRVDILPAPIDKTQFKLRSCCKKQQPGLLSPDSFKRARGLKEVCVELVTWFMFWAFLSLLNSQRN